MTLATRVAGHEPLPGTAPWHDRKGYDDDAAGMVEGIHRFLDRALAEAPSERHAFWDRQYGSPQAYIESIEPNRRRLEMILGAIDGRPDRPSLSYVAGPDQPEILAESSQVIVRAVRWAVYKDVWAEGLLLEPEGVPQSDVVAIPDCAQTPEDYAGLTAELEPSAQVARLLAESGCRVLIPALIDRATTFSGHPEVGMTNLSHREWIWRQGFEVGRHPLGYEVDLVRSGIDWLQTTASKERPVGVVGYGEGGLVTLLAAALDRRIHAAWVAGSFGTLRDIWRQPIDRDVWALHESFGDAEIASLIEPPRSLLIEPCVGPSVDGPPEPVNGRALAASGRLDSPRLEDAKAEYQRLLDLTNELNDREYSLSTMGEGNTHNSGNVAATAFLSALSGGRQHDPESVPRTPTPPEWASRGALPDPVARMGRLVHQLQEHTQALIRVSELRRYELWKTVDADATSTETWSTKVEPLRERFWGDVLGKFPAASEPLQVRTVQILDEPNFLGYAVEIPVWPDVVASGVILLPKDLTEGEQRPVVVCQHGLEGTPEPIVDKRVDSVYHAYGAHLADRGLIVYAPQNPYKGHDRFRQIQRKAHPLGKSLFGIIVRQHERTLEWLKTLPNVDPSRIAFYGLSYGGKTAMRVPALLPDYCLSICSADFNEWVVKCTNLVRPYSYMYTVEYDMYEWNLAGGFNYSEMAKLIAPRPFQVERGHDDGVAPDEWIGYEFAKVKRAYDRLGLGDRCDITYFNGPHEIHGGGTFRFLARQLDWPRAEVPMTP